LKHCRANLELFAVQAVYSGVSIGHEGTKNPAVTSCGKAQMSLRRSPVPEKNGRWMGKRVANPRSRKKIRKTPHVDCGESIKWEITIKLKVAFA
jgi:hypothetical protein